MKKQVVMAGAAMLLSASVLSAQATSSQCPSGPLLSVAQLTQDACQKAVDVFQYLAPQLGGAITGGNATLGQGGTMGGLGHFSVGLRVNAVKGSVPAVDEPAVQPSLTGARSSNFETDVLPVPMLTADAAIGIFKGFPLGLTNVGGVDVLASATYIPNANVAGVAVEPDNPLKVGYGVRVGLLQESIALPGIAATFLKRDLPKLSITGEASGSTLRVRDLDEETTAWRIVASKSLVLFGLAAGYGQDTYKSSATASATSQGVTSSNIAVSQDLTRTNMFADLSLNLPIFKLIVEIGQVSGGDAPATFNTFQGTGIVDSRMYGSLGVRFAW